MKTSQISTKYPAGSSEKAVDGNTDGTFSKYPPGSCTHTRRFSVIIVIFYLSCGMVCIVYVDGQPNHFIYVVHMTTC